MTFGVIFIVLTITLLVCWLCWLCSDPGDRLSSILVGFIVTNAICYALLSIAMWISYDNYLDIKVYPETAYRQNYAAIMEYNRIISSKEGHGGEITDMKFQGYQGQMADLVNTHKRAVIEHNKMVVGKKVLAENALIGFLIVEADPGTEALPLIPK